MLVVFGVVMNFPVGGMLAKGSLPFDFMGLAQQLAERNFNGYLVQTVKSDLIEEGVLFFREGTIVACVAECLGSKKVVKGDEASSYFFNQTKGNGFFHVVELAKSQVDLVIAFDEKLLLSKIDLKDIPKLIPIAFEPKFSIEKGDSFSLENYGLGELKK